MIEKSNSNEIQESRRKPIVNTRAEINELEKQQEKHEIKVILLEILIKLINI